MKLFLNHSNLVETKVSFLFSYLFFLFLMLTQSVTAGAEDWLSKTANTNACNVYKKSYYVNGSSAARSTAIDNFKYIIENPRGDYCKRMIADNVVANYEIVKNNVINYSSDAQVAWQRTCERDTCLAYSGSSASREETVTPQTPDVRSSKADTPTISTCPVGQARCPNGACSPKGSACCNDGRVCPSGSICVKDGGCLSKNSPRFCEGHSYCGEGFVCEGGTTCRREANNSPQPPVKNSPTTKSDDNAAIVISDGGKGQVAAWCFGYPTNVDAYRAAVKNCELHGGENCKLATTTASNGSCLAISRRRITEGPVQLTDDYEFKPGIGMLKTFAEGSAACFQCKLLWSYCTKLDKTASLSDADCDYENLNEGWIGIDDMK